MKHATPQTMVENEGEVQVEPEGDPGCGAQGREQVQERDADPSCNYSLPSSQHLLPALGLQLHGRAA